MRKSKLMSAVKYLTMAACGALFAIGIFGSSKLSAKAKTFDGFPYIEDWDESQGLLKLTGNVVNVEDGGLVLPSEIDKANIQLIYTNNAVFPADSHELFENFSNLRGVRLDSVNTSSVTDMSYMFNGCTNLSGVTISGWNTNNVTKFSGMFLDCSSIEELDLTSLTVSQIRDYVPEGQQYFTDNIGYLFSGCTKLKRIVVNPDTWIIDDSVYGTDMFYLAYNLVGGNGTLYDCNKTNKEYARIDTADIPGYLSSSNSVTVYGQVSTDGSSFAFKVSFLTKTPGEHTYKILYDNNELATYVLTVDDEYGKDGEAVISVPAKEMNTPKTLVVTVDSSSVFSKEISVAGYLRSINYAADANSDLYKVTGAMLRYGAAAIEYFNPGHSPSNLPNYDIDNYNNLDFTSSFDNYTSENTKITPKSITTTDGEWAYSGFAVSLEGEVNLMMAFKIPDSVNITEWSIYASKDSFESELKALITTTDFKDKTTFRLDGTGKYVLAVTPVNILNLNDNIYLGDDSGFGNPISAGTYLYRNYMNTNSSDNLKYVCNSLYAFHKEAVNYNNSTSN